VDHGLAVTPVLGLLPAQRPRNFLLFPRGDRVGAQALGRDSVESREPDLQHLSVRLAREEVRLADGCLRPIEMTQQRTQAGLGASPGDRRRRHRSAQVLETQPPGVASSERRGVIVDGVVRDPSRLLEQRLQDLRHLESSVAQQQGLDRLEDDDRRLPTPEILGDQQGLPPMLNRHLGLVAVHVRQGDFVEGGQKLESEALADVRILCFLGEQRQPLDGEPQLGTGIAPAAIDAGGR